jgi:rhodanese-related sulfurtransferase
MSPEGFMSKKVRNVFTQLQEFESQIEHLEGKVLELEQKLDRLIEIERNHLIRIKNREELSDEFISQGRLYQDLSPEKAWKLYSNRDFDFILLDVSSAQFKPVEEIPEAIKIPWEDFRDRFTEIQSRTTPLFIISEDGTSSILACEFLVKHGFYNCNNISGGYKHWKGFQLKNINRTA